MDNFGSNRYQLLFMDDDISTPTTIEVPVTAKAESKKKQQQQKGAVAATKKNQANKKPVSEKENKSSALNRNESGKNVGNNSASKAKPAINATTEEKLRPDAIDATDGGRNVGFKLQNNDNRDQRPRRNFRDGDANNVGGNEYNSDQQRAPRQFRERENRGMPRNRTGEVSFRSGKREFDRQSGSDKTGVKAIDKRNGGGAHNWGSAKQDIDDLNKSNTDTDAILTDKEESGNDQSAEQVVVPEEEETKELTLDEWKALRQTRNKPQFNIRKAGEGEDTTQWKKMIALNKKKDGESEEELEYDPSMYPQRVGRLQRIVDIQFNFNDGRRVGFGGFGRGRGRGAMRPGGERLRFEGGRGGAHGDAADRPNVGRSRIYGDRASRGEQTSFKVDDERQFPTLS